MFEERPGSSRKVALKRTVGRFLATVIVGAILVYFTWWIFGVLAVVVLVLGGVKVWEWSTAIRPRSRANSHDQSPRRSQHRCAGRWCMRQGSTSDPAGPQTVTVRAVRRAAARSLDPASTGPTRRLWGCHTARQPLLVFNCVDQSM